MIRKKRCFLCFGMAATSKSRLDMKHGFMKKIIQNQVDRDNYDKEVKAKTSEKPKRFSFQPPKNRRPDIATYIPPPRLEPAADDNNHELSEEPDIPKTLFVFEFEDKDGKVYKQYVKEGVRAELLAQRMGYDRKLTPGMIQALQDRLQEEIDKRTQIPNS